MDVLNELAAAAAPPLARHGCKVCGKRFLSGRSLGGHMRSHVSLGDAAALAAEVHAAAAGGGRSCNGAAVVGSYGLRENPRKTRRLSDFADDDEDGDGDGDGEHTLFRQSHASGGGGGGRYRDDDEDDVEEEEFVPVPEEAAAAEAEETETVTPTMEEVPAALTVLSALPRRKRRTMRVAATHPTWPPPPVLSGGGFEKEPEDVALCLLMLSRDTGVRKRSSPFQDKPFESSAKKKKKKKQQAGLPRTGTGYSYNSDDELETKIKSRKRGSHSHPKQHKQQRGPVPVPVAVSPTKRTRFECPGCGRAFGSYQALGGHRASHKRINASCSSSSPKVATAAPEEPISTETYASSFDTLSPSASPDSVVAMIGFGGKSSSNVELYYVGSSDHAGHQEKHSAAADGFLDLNFPPAAPEEED